MSMFYFFYEMRKPMYDPKLLLSLPNFPSRDPVFISLNNKESNVRKKKSWKYFITFFELFLYSCGVCMSVNWIVDGYAL